MLFGKYNNERQYMIHRVYICDNLNYPFVVRNFDPLKGRFYSTFPKLYFGETSFHPRRGALLLATYPYFVFYWY
jgi:hypothetical protein